jgi:hypothetical protein
MVEYGSNTYLISMNDSDRSKWIFNEKDENNKYARKKQTNNSQPSSFNEEKTRVLIIHMKDYVFYFHLGKKRWQNSLTSRDIGYVLTCKRRSRRKEEDR